MNQVIWNGVGGIGDDLVSGANETAVRNRFRRRKRNLWIKYGSMAACLCLVVCLCVPLINSLVRNAEGNAESFGNGILITHQTSHGEKPTLPWSDTLAYSLRTAKSVYNRSEKPVVELGFGLAKDALGNGVLKVVIDTGDFTTTAEREVSVGDFTHPEYAGADAVKMSIPLIPSEKETFGSICISFLFRPDDSESAEYADYIQDGMLNIGTISLSYVVNAYEIVLSQTNAYDLFEIRLAELYRTKKIDGQEFADRYFAAAYANTVCASVSTVKPDGSYDFIYRSKNIRYDSPYLTDTAIKDAMNDEDERLIVRLALEYMLSGGVITQAEYDEELEWVAEVRHAGMFDIAFDQNVAEYAHDVLQKYMYTHE